MMGISRNEKQVLVQELVEQLGQAKGAVLTDYKGINEMCIRDRGLWVPVPNRFP